MAPEIIAGRYRVLRAVGRGGMGTVWLCRDEVLGREVAVKQVGTLPGDSVPDLARALREARSSAALNHPHVVSVFDAIETDDHIWLVMEYVAGSTLSELIARDGRLDPVRVAAIGAQIADGLAAAHARGTVHRDVKPGNVLISDGDVAKISDFGIARTAGDAQLTRSGLLIGTPLYFSPELAGGADPTPASDVWALGATLYAAVEGEPPVRDRGNPIATLAAIAEGRPLRPEHADFLAGALSRMLDPDPASRWSMADAAHALHRLHKQHRPPDTRVATAASPAPPDTRAAPAATGAPPAGPDTPVVEPARPRPRRRTPLLVALIGVLLLGGTAAAAALLDQRDQPSSASDGPESTRSTTSQPAAPSNTAAPTSAATPSTSAATPSSSPSLSAPPAAAPDGPEQAVVDYYALLPEDTESAWEVLGPELQREIGYGSFTGFWDTIEDVVVDDTSTTSDGRVAVTLTYTREDGMVESETRELVVTDSAGTWLITQDDVA